MNVVEYLCSGQHRISMPNSRLQTDFLTPMLLPPLPDHPLVSILMPSHNYASYLGEAIESCLRQSYRHFELIICDDGSTDSSPQILKQYQSADQRINAIFQVNAGQAAALNAAFRISAGDVICLLDADDVFSPGKLQSVIDAFASAPDSGLAVHKMLRVDKKGKYLGESPLFCSLPSGWQGPFLILNAPLLLSGIPPCSGLSLRRPVAEAAFPIPRNLTVFADAWIQILCPVLTPIVAIQTHLSEYRVHGCNASGSRVGGYTQGRLRNIVAYEREAWRAWRRYVESISPSLAPKFQLPSDKEPSLMGYAYSRFTSDSSSERTCAALSPERIRGLPWVQRWFWRFSKMIPNWLFKRSFNFIYGQTRTKLFVGKVFRLCRNSLPFRSTLFKGGRRALV